MIYISIDNDYHAEQALLLLKLIGIKNSDVKFISHKSRRNTIIGKVDCSKIIIEGHPLSNGSGYKRFSSYFNSIKFQKELHAIFNFGESDILLIFTEHQLNNAILARMVMRAGGNVYLFDEGVGFYFNNSSLDKSPLAWVNVFYLWLYNLAFFSLGLPVYARKGYEGRMFVCIKEKYIDVFYSRMRLPINRNFSIAGYKNFLISEHASREKNGNVAIFFANNLKVFGLQKEELIISRAAIKRMASVFKEVLIKIHPMDFIERNETYYFYQSMAFESSNIILLDNGLTANEVLRKFKPRFVVGTLGTALFDAFSFGSQPIFLFQLLPKVPQLRLWDIVLRRIGYRFINSVNEIDYNYQSCVSINSLEYTENEFDVWFEGTAVVKSVESC